VTTCGACLDYKTVSNRLDRKNVTIARDGATHCEAWIRVAELGTSPAASVKEQLNRLVGEGEAALPLREVRKMGVLLVIFSPA
jgi:hypothetical protein